MFSLYAADGRLLTTIELQGGAVTTLKAKDLAAGMYFYRAIGGSTVFTGALSKQ